MSCFPLKAMSTCMAARNLYSQLSANGLTVHSRYCPKGSRQIKWLFHASQIISCFLVPSPIKGSFKLWSFSDVQKQICVVPEIAPSCFGLWSQCLSYVSQIITVTVFQPGLPTVSSWVFSAIGLLELTKTVAWDTAGQKYQEINTS